jgi:hypothetical protein
MIDPRTVREATIAQAGLEARLGLLQKLILAVIGLLGAILLGAAAIYVQVGDLKTDVAVTKNTVATINERVAKMEKGIDDIRSETGQIRSETGQILSRVARLDPQPVPQRPQPASPPDLRNVIGGFYVTEGEGKALRELLGAPQKTDAPPKIGLWQRVSEQLLKPIPDDVAAKLPKLKGLRYAIDPGNNAIALAEPSGLVIATI